MDVGTRSSILNLAISPDLEDKVTSIIEKDALTAGPTEDLDCNPKRWLTVGVCLHTIISPVLREYIFPILIKLYYRLLRIYKIDKQTSPFKSKTFLHYENINNNKNVYGNRKNQYDYRVQNPVDLSKLVLQIHMAKYKGIDDTCDLSALLTIIKNIDEFPVAVRSIADQIRSNIRNPWAHCKLKEWDKGKFATSFVEMGTFISSLDMKASVKQSTLEKITKLETNDILFVNGTLLGHVGFEIVKEISHGTSVLAIYATVLKFNLENEIENRTAADKVIQDELVTLLDKIKNIIKRQEEIIPEQIQDRNADEIRGWEKDDEKFVITRATEHAMTWIANRNIAVVTGSSGAGKSFLIHHVALELHRGKKYDIIPLSFATAPSSIMSYYCKHRNQVFVIDDICGKSTIHVPYVNIWKDLTEKINELFKLNSTESKETIGPKLLVSCRLQVFNDSQFKGITCFTENVFNIVSDRHCLLPEERLLMIKKYVKSDNIDDVIDHISDFDFFPLLCKMSTNIAHENLKRFFENPIDTIKENIQQIIDSNNKHQLCALVLCILFEEGFEEEWINCRLNKITRHCDVDLDREFVRLSLKNGFSTLVGTFLKKIGTTYSFIHDKIYDIASIVCGTYLKECFIRNANERFIGDKYIFEINKTYPPGNFIVLSKDIEEEYFERLVDDLKQGNIYSTLHNKQLVDESFRKRLIKYLNRNVEGVHGLFNEIDKKGIKLKTDICQYYWNECVDIDDEDEVTDDEVTHDDVTSDKDSNHEVTNDEVSNHEVTYVTFPLIEAATEGYADIVEFLIKLKCNVNKLDSFNKSALYKACEGGYEVIVEKLLEYGADASLSSPLYMACKTGNAYIVKLLLAGNVDDCKVDRDFTSPLPDTCKHGNVHIPKLRLRNDAYVNMSNGWMKYCPLHIACEIGNLDIVKQLLETNANVNSVSRLDDTPLSLACEGGYAEIVKELLENKEMANVLGSQTKKSPLFLACGTGKVDIVKMLFATKTDIYPNIDTGSAIYSPLCNACKHNHINVVQYLLHQCIDKFSSYDKFYAMKTASLYGCKDIVKEFMDSSMFNSREEIDFLKGAPLYSACRGGNLETVKYLLTKDLDIFWCSNDDRSLLHAACEVFQENCEVPRETYEVNHETEGHKSIINLLIKKQLLVSKQDKNGLTPLHLACRDGSLSICKLLISEQAKVNMQDKRNWSPLHFACHGIKSDIVEVLLKNKANTNLCDHDGQTPLDVLQKSCFSQQNMFVNPVEIAERYAKCKSIIKSILDHDPEMKLSDNEGKTKIINQKIYFPLRNEIKTIIFGV